MTFYNILYYIDDKQNQTMKDQHLFCIGTKFATYEENEQLVTS